MACEGECDKSFCINCNDSAKCENKIGTLAPEVITIGTPPGIGIRTDMPVKVISDGANAVHINTQAGISVDNIRLEIYRNRSDMEAQITLKDTGD
jgi:sRNA-binding carbon storage regulator CsrA